jgi:hypothetical protein
MPSGGAATEANGTVHADEVAAANTVQPAAVHHGAMVMFVQGEQQRKPT